MSLYLGTRLSKTPFGEFVATWLPYGILLFILIGIIFLIVDFYTFSKERKIMTDENKCCGGETCETAPETCTAETECTENTDCTGTGDVETCTEGDACCKKQAETPEEMVKEIAQEIVDIVNAQSVVDSQVDVVAPAATETIDCQGGIPSECCPETLNEGGPTATNTASDSEVITSIEQCPEGVSISECCPHLETTSETCEQDGCDGNVEDCEKEDCPNK